MKQIIIACLLLPSLLLGASVSSPHATGNYSWKNVAIGGGGYVTGVIYNPAEEDLLYTRTDVGGAYRWNSLNKTWTPLMDSVGKDKGDDLGVLSLAVDPVDTNNVYMMTGLYTQSWAGKGAFYSSTNKGETWTRTSLPFKVGGNENGRGNGERLQVDPNLPSRLFMGTTKDGLWRSDDYGSSWTQITSVPSTNITFVSLDSTSSSYGTATQRIFIGTTNSPDNMYVSNDGGNSWSVMSNQPTGMYPMRFALSTENLFVTYSSFPSSYDIGGPNGATSGAVYKYHIATNTWSNISPTTEDWYGYGGITVDKQNPNHLLVSTLDRWWPGDEVYQSTDGGSSWTPVLSTGTRDDSKAPYVKGYTPHWITDIQIDPFNSNKAIFVTGYGIYMTENLLDTSVTWVFENTGLEETVPLELKSPPSGTQLLSAVGDITGFKHDDLSVSSANGTFNHARGTNQSIDFAEDVPTKVVRTHVKGRTSAGSYSTDGGISWTEFASMPSGAERHGQISISADGTKIVWTPVSTSGSLMGSYVSADNGASWTASTGIDSGLKTVSDHVYSNNFYAFDGLNGRVFSSTDGGYSFSEGATGLPRLPGWKLHEGVLKTVFGKEGHLWITASAEGLYRSTNSGNSFSKVSSVDEAYKVGFGKASTQTGYPAVFIVGIVDGDYGFFRSDDEGATWVQINTKEQQFGYINDITGDPKVYGRVYVATGGRGIVYRDLGNE